MRNVPYISPPLHQLHGCTVIWGWGGGGGGGVGDTLNSLNAKCIYTCMYTLSASPFMQCYVLYFVDQNHFEYAILTCI